MKPINKKSLKDALATALLVVFVLSGWIAFVISETNKDKEIADEINRQTVSLRQQITPIRDTVFKYQDNSSIYKFVDELIAEKENLADSVEYYSMFYDIVRDNYSFDYTVQKEYSKDRIVYKCTLGPIIRINKDKITSTHIKVNDSIVDPEK